LDTHKEGLKSVLDQVQEKGKNLKEDAFDRGVLTKQQADRVEASSIGKKVGIDIKDRALDLRASMAYNIIKKMNTKISGFDTERFNKIMGSEIKKLEKNNVDTSSLKEEVKKSLNQLTESRDKFLGTFKVYQDLIDKKESGTLTKDDRGRFIELERQIQDSSKEFRETQEKIVTKVQREATESRPATGATLENSNKDLGKATEAPPLERKDQETVSTRSVPLVLSHKSDANTDNFLRAAARGNFAELDRLISKENTNIFAKDERGNTVLHIAARNGREDVIEYLLSKNSDVSKLTTEKNEAGYTAMETAVAAASNSNLARRVNTSGVQRVLANQEVEKALSSARDTMSQQATEVSSTASENSFSDRGVSKSKSKPQESLSSTSTEPMRPQGPKTLLVSDNRELGTQREVNLSNMPTESNQPLQRSRSDVMRDVKQVLDQRTVSNVEEAVRKARNSQDVDKILRDTDAGIKRYQELRKVIDEAGVRGNFAEFDDKARRAQNALGVIQKGLDPNAESHLKYTKGRALDQGLGAYQNILESNKELERIAENLIKKKKDSKG